MYMRHTPKPPVADPHPNLHVVTCQENTETKQVVKALVPYNATTIWFLCNQCKRRHHWIIDPALRKAASKKSTSASWTD